MLRTIRDLLQKVICDIDSGSSDITPKEALEIIDLLKSYTDRKEKLSKYQACRYLNVSRATFDNYVRAGKLPRGKKEAGWKELPWTKQELDTCLSRMKKT